MGKLSFILAQLFKALMEKNLAEVNKLLEKPELSVELTKSGRVLIRMCRLIEYKNVKKLLSKPELLNLIIKNESAFSLLFSKVASAGNIDEIEYLLSEAKRNNIDVFNLLAKGLQAIVNNKHNKIDLATIRRLIKHFFDSMVIEEGLNLDQVKKIFTQRRGFPPSEDLSLEELKQKLKGFYHLIIHNLLYTAVSKGKNGHLEIVKSLLLEPKVIEELATTAAYLPEQLLKFSASRNDGPMTYLLADVFYRKKQLVLPKGITIEHNGEKMPLLQFLKTYEKELKEQAALMKELQNKESIAPGVKPTGRKPLPAAVTDMIGQYLGFSDLPTINQRDIDRKKIGEQLLSMLSKLKSLDPKAKQETKEQIESLMKLKDQYKLTLEYRMPGGESLGGAIRDALGEKNPRLSEIVSNLFRPQSAVPPSPTSAKRSTKRQPRSS